MDLTTAVPRSPRDKMDGIVSLGRTYDKARAYIEGKLGEYDYNCPHDKPVLSFLGVDAETFAKKASELDEGGFARWAQEFLSKKTPQQIADFNAQRLDWRPEPGSPSAEYYEKLLQQIAPGRKDIKTWFDALDLDEKRPVTNPHP